MHRNLNAHHPVSDHLCVYPGPLFLGPRHQGEMPRYRRSRFCKQRKRHPTRPDNLGPAHA